MHEYAFSFEALRLDGTRQSGVLRAPSIAAAKHRLEAEGLFVTTIEERIVRGPSNWLARRRMSASHLVVGLRMLSTILASGLPLSRAITLFARTAPGAWQSILPDVRRLVTEGRSLADALASVDASIPPLYLALIRAGEASGALATGVERAAVTAEADAEARSALRAALAYPILLFSTGAAASVLLIGVVLPRFSQILEDLGRELPRSTEAVMFLASVARACILPAALIIAMLTTAWLALRRFPHGRFVIDGILLHIPLMGRVRGQAASARFCTALAELLERGTPLTSALTHAADASGNSVISSRVASARSRVIRGDGIAVSLEEEHAVSTIAASFIRAGEASGQLTHMLAHAGRFESAAAIRTVTTLVRFLEPGLVIIFGGAVGLIAVSLLQAVYSVRPG
jgi:type II secretory pathway component PulF